MRRKYVKSVHLIFLIVTLIGFIAGCSGSTFKINAGGIFGIFRNRQAADDSPKPDTINIFIREVYNGVKLNEEMIGYLEEKTNTDLQITAFPASTFEDRIFLMLASGEKPDVIQFLTDEMELRYVEAGMLLPLNDLIETRAPNLKNNWGDETWDLMRHPDGNIYAIPYKGTKVDITLVYRKDWLDKLGMKIPETIEEYYEAAVAMAKNDPDGNGRDDTYAFSNFDSFGDLRYFDHIFGAYGTLLEHWINVNGRVFNGSVLPGAKEGLKMMKRLYDAGALDPEFITDDYSRHNLKTQRGMYGAMCTYLFYMEPVCIDYQKFKEYNPEGKLVQGPLLTSSFTGNNLGMRVTSQRGWLKTAVLKDARNVDAIMRLFDWLASDEGAKYTIYGIEGRDFRENEGGFVELLTPRDEYPKYGVMQMYLITRNIYYHFTPEFFKAKVFAEKNSVTCAVDGILVPESSQYSSDLFEYTKEQFAKMIVGEIPIETGFIDYVNEWYLRGGRELTDSYNAAFNKRNNRS